MTDRKPLTRQQARELFMASEHYEDMRNRKRTWIDRLTETPRKRKITGWAALRVDDMTKPE